jgi:aconitate hydratase
VIGVALGGAPPAGVGGAEIVRALEQRLEGCARGAVLEYHGDGVGSLPMSERIATASLGGVCLGAAASVFPSDERTREYLAARGRDADWRRTAGDADGFDEAVTLDLGRVASAERRGGRVRIGALAEDDDLLALARAGEARAGLGEVTIVVGGRAARAALEDAGALATLERRGALVVDLADAQAHAPLEPESWVCGDEGEIEAGRARALSTPALLASLGLEAEALAEPEPAPGRRPGAALAPGEVLPAAAPAAAVMPERSAVHVPPALLPPLPATVRGVVLVHASGDLDGPALLGWGPRAQARRGDAAELATLVLRDLAPDLAPRARGRRWSVLSCAGRWGDEARHDDVARALAALGVRVVIARAYADGHAGALAAHGVLPLAWHRDDDDRRVGAGEELELPAAAETLAGDGRMVVRNLTRGLAFDLRVELDARGRAIAAAGGLLASLVRAPAGAGA